VSLTPEIDLDTAGTPHCPVCFAEIDIWTIEKRSIERERARIIALLKQHIGYGDDEQDEYFTDAIALIKGDNK
jgi:hypothetical protein